MFPDKLAHDGRSFRKNWLIRRLWWVTIRHNFTICSHIIISKQDLQQNVVWSQHQCLRVTVSSKRQMQRTQNATLWRVRVTTVAVKTQQYVALYCSATRNCQQYKISYCTTMFLQRKHVTGNNKTYFGLYVKWPVFLSDLHRTQRF